MGLNCSNYEICKTRSLYVCSLNENQLKNFFYLCYIYDITIKKVDMNDNKIIINANEQQVIYIREHCKSVHGLYDIPLSFPPHGYSKF